MRFVTIFVLFLLPAPLWADYTIEELKLMTLKELYIEAASSCVAYHKHRSTVEAIGKSVPRFAEAAEGYDPFTRELENTWRVAREKNKGAYPKWALRQQQAMKERKPDLCYSPEFK